MNKLLTRLLGSSPSSNDDVDATPLLKALSLDQARAKAEVWPLHDALRSSVDSILGDETMTADDKHQALAQTVGDYASRLLALNVPDAADANDDLGDDELDDGYDDADYAAGGPDQIVNDPIAARNAGLTTKADPSTPPARLSLVQPPCPDCGSTNNPVTAIYCARCGADLGTIDDTTIDENYASKAADPKMKTCPDCKAKLPVGETECPDCGTVVKAADALPSTTAQESTMDLLKQAEILKGLPDQVTKLFADLTEAKATSDAVAKAAAERLTKLEEIAKDRDRLDCARALVKGTTLKAEDVAVLLKGDDATVKATEAMVKALAEAQAQAGIFKVIGGDVTTDVSGHDELLAKAAELRKIKPTLTDAQAYREVAQANPDLYAQTV